VLSLAASYGFLVWGFQDAHLASLLGFEPPGGIDPTIPLVMFAVVFGLSMDYEIFLVMRIHEEWLRSGDNRASVRRGLAATGGTITAAAAIMIVVFGSFVLGGERVIKEFGVGLAAAIFVDAVVIRTTLVPSLMLLMGKANWWFPSWLSWVPRIHMEPENHVEDLEPAGVA